MNSSAIFNSFFKSYDDDFSGFEQDDDECYLQNCDLYQVEENLERTLSIVINFIGEKTYPVFENIIFSNYNRNLFERKYKNGLVYTFLYNSEKVALTLYESTGTLHIQGKGCKKWFEKEFNVLGKVLHNEILYFQNEDQQNVSNILIKSAEEFDLSERSNILIKPMVEFDFSETIINDQSLVCDRSQTNIKLPNDDSQTNLKLKIPPLSSTPVIPIKVTNKSDKKEDKRIVSLLKEVSELKEQVTSLKDTIKLLSQKHQNVTIAMSTQTPTKSVSKASSTQARSNVISRHTSMNTISYRSIATQVYKIEEDSVNTTSELACGEQSTECQKVCTGNDKLTIPSINNKPQIKTKPDVKQNNKTLIMGSSLLKGIRPRGLKNTDVRTNPGANIDRLMFVTKGMDMTPYLTVVLHVGGNDLENGDSLDVISENYESLLLLLRDRCNKNCVIMVSGIPPRKRLNVGPLNDMLRDMCEYLNIQFIDHSCVFTDSNGNVNYKLFSYDKLHLSPTGTAELLKSINRYVNILGESNSMYCYCCGEPNHNSTSCKHGQKILCHLCNSYGHKQKFCHLYF